MGDLNYRIMLDEASAKELIKMEKYSELLAFDQLSMEKKSGRAFGDFEEGEINFKPSYKFDVGTNDYDTRFSMA